jgi:anti-sigma regulatory factor (Ser/Thr protein kinase)
MRDTATSPPVGTTECAWSRTFPSTPDQVAKARRFLAALLAGSTVTDDALVCLSELVTNAVCHSRSGRPGGTFTVRAALTGTTLRVAVEDQGGRWAPRPGTSRGEQRGRGLVIVRQLARAWGRTGGSGIGRTVWFTMDLPAG